MDKLFQNNTDGEGEHPPRETLLLWVDGELSSREATQIQTHLEACWHCRVKTKKIEEAIADIIEFDEEILKTRLLPPNNWRGFDLRLSQLAAEGDTRSLISKVLGPLGRFFSTVNLFFMPRPLVRVFVALLLLALIVVFAFRIGEEPVVSASELLRQATEAQATRINKTTQAVIHQQLRVRRVGGSSPSDSVDWEIWNDTTSPRFRQSVSENGQRRFIASSTTTSKGDGADSTPSVLSNLATALRANHMDPQRPLSPISFKMWRDSLEQKHDEITKSRLPGGAEALTLRTVRIGETNIGHIAQASLLVRAGDWHPEALRLIVKGEGRNYEFELIETAFQVVSLPALAPEIFSEQPQQIAGTQLPSAGPSASPMLNVNPLPLAGTPTHVVATAELEIEVLRLLNQAGADLGEQVSATRTPDGLLRVEGIVETEVRKNEILRTLEPVRNNPAVRIEIKSVAEALAEKRGEVSKPSQPA
ncbi:MAG TPA: zf-HC2 domain-containing protein, partial [Pyrinomonadaceae bacterium]|nr:zf-HC2 domain-containing protein [Pyrinomonadaceae bacterium]